MAVNNQTLSSFIQNYFQDVELKKIVSDVIGLDKPDAIATFANKLIESNLNSSIKEIIFIEPSAGVVFGLLLSSGQKVILKIFNKNIPYDYLRKINDIQITFYSEKFPAPKVLSPLTKFNKNHAGIYELIEGEKENGHDPKIRNELAKYLARFSEIIDKYNFDLIYTFMQKSAQGKLWPTPHNILFDFNKTRRGAGWIAKKAIAARKIISAASLKKRVSHTDWDVKNTVFKNKKLVGVFDWDALGSMSEPEMVGRASAQFTADWESKNKITPTPDESRLFVKSYEEHRKRQFSREEYQVASAAADYLIAMIARFEHAGGNPTVHPYQDLLNECGKKSFLFVT